MKLYCTPGSPYARMARIVVIEKELARRVEVVFARTRKTDSPYYRINPSGRVPYLVRDDGVGMEESGLICAYLDQLARSGGITPARATAVRGVLDRGDAATRSSLASQLETDATAASSIDAARLRALAGVIRNLR